MVVPSTATVAARLLAVTHRQRNRNSNGWPVDGLTRLQLKQPQLSQLVTTMVPPEPWQLTVTGPAASPATNEQSTAEASNRLLEEFLSRIIHKGSAFIASVLANLAADI